MQPQSTSWQNWICHRPSSVASEHLEPQSQLRDLLWLPRLVVNELVMISITNLAIWIAISKLIVANIITIACRFSIDPIPFAWLKSISKTNWIVVHTTNSCLWVLPFSLCVLCRCCASRFVHFSYLSLRHPLDHSHPLTAWLPFIPWR